MFITFEGIEGCGKSTQIERLIKRIEISGIPVIQTFEPGGTRIGKAIRQTLLDAKNSDLDTLAELLLYLADRAQHVGEIVKPALEKGKWVVCDRFFDATFAYQGAARGQDMELIQSLNKLVSQSIKPDITFLLDCPVEVGLDRAKNRKETSENRGQDRFERERIEFHFKVKRAYLELAKKEPQRFRVIDATLSIDEMAETIFEHLKPFLGESGA